MCARVRECVYTCVCAWKLIYLKRVWRQVCTCRWIGITRSLHVVSLTFVLHIFTFCLRKLTVLFSLFVCCVTDVSYQVISLEIMRSM